MNANPAIAEYAKQLTAAASQLNALLSKPPAGAVVEIRTQDVTAAKDPARIEIIAVTVKEEIIYL